MSSCVVADCGVGDGDRDDIPAVNAGLPMDFKTVSRVRSILRIDLVRISCFL